VPGALPPRAGDPVPGQDLPDGTFELVCEWRRPTVKTVTELRYHVQKITPTPSFEGYEHLEQRKAQVLDFYAQTSDAARVEPVSALQLWGGMTRWMKRCCAPPVNSSAARNDTADFVMQAILRLLYWGT